MNPVFGSGVDAKYHAPSSPQLQTAPTPRLPSGPLMIILDHLLAFLSAVFVVNDGEGDGGGLPPGSPPMRMSKYFKFLSKWLC